MARPLSWRARGVLNLLATVCLLCTCFHSRAQSVTAPEADPRISLSVQGQYFHDVIDRLAGITGLHFVYSSNKVEANTRISLSVVNSPLEDVLELLGKQMNLSFKVQGRYVIVKTLPAQRAVQAIRTEPHPVA